MPTRRVTKKSRRRGKKSKRKKKSPRKRFRMSGGTKTSKPTKKKSSQENVLEKQVIEVLKTGFIDWVNEVGIHLSHREVTKKENKSYTLELKHKKDSWRQVVLYEGTLEGDKSEYEYYGNITVDGNAKSITIAHVDLTGTQIRCSDSLTQCIALALHGDETEQIKPINPPKGEVIIVSTTPLKALLCFSKAFANNSYVLSNILDRDFIKFIRGIGYLVDKKDKVTLQCSFTRK